MAVVVDSIDTTPALASGATSLNLTTLTIGSITNGALYAVLVTQDVTSAVTLTWDSGGTNQAMTPIGSVVDPSNATKTYAFGLVAPTSGNKTLAASWTGTSAASLSAASFSGVNQSGGTASFANLVTATGSLFTNATAAMAGVSAFTASPKVPNVHAAATFSAVGSFKASATLPGGYPGQAGNPVGFAAAPGYTGSLTVFSGTLVSGTSGAHQVYSHLDFQNGTTARTINNLSYVDFIGCRFQSNAVAAWPAPTSASNVIVSGTSNNITFQYCSFTPLTSIATVTPGGPAWPCVGTGTNTNNQIAGTNSLSETQGYTYGLLIESISGPLTVDHCDFWGFGNVAIFFSATTPQITVSSSWLHDMLAEGPLYQQHQDVIGFLLDQTAGVQNVNIENCTLASMGSDNTVAFQGATDVVTAYANISVTGCYITGCGFTITLPGGVEMFNPGVTTITPPLNFYNNIISTEIPWIFGPLYAYYQTNFTPSTWFNNILKVLPGGTPLSGSNSNAFYTSANNGNYVWPDTSYHATDWPGNGGTVVEATAAFAASGGFASSAKIPSITTSAAMSGTAALNAYPGSIAPALGAATLAGIGAFTSRSVGPAPDMFVIGAINTGAINAHPINQRKVIAIEIFQSVGMTAGAAFTVASRIPAREIIAQMAGGAAFVISSVPAVRTSAAMPGIATFAASGSAALKSIAAMGGVGLLTVHDTPRVSNSASLSAAALFTASAIHGPGVTGAMSGLGAFTVSEFPAIEILAAMAATGSFFALPQSPYSVGAAIMAAVGSLTASGHSFITLPTAAMAGVGSFSLTGIPFIGSNVSMSGLSALSAAAGIFSVGASMSVATVFTVGAGQYVVMPTSAMAALGTMGISTSGQFINQTASMAALGSLTIAANRLSGASAMAAIGSFAMTGGSTPTLSAAAMASIGSFALIGIPALKATSSLAALGAFGITPEVAAEIAAAFAGSGGFSITGLPGELPAAIFSAMASFSASEAGSVYSTATFSGAGSLVTDLHLPAVGISLFDGESEFVIYGSVLKPSRLIAPLSRTASTASSARLTNASRS